MAILSNHLTRHLAAALLAAVAISASARPPPDSTTAYPGAVTIQVDATNIGQWVFQVRERVPASSGPLQLLYPRWLPGFHGPYGDPTLIGGLTVEANGQRVPWSRSSVNPSAFDVQVPEGAKAVEVSFQWLGNPKSSSYPPPMSKDMLGIQWASMVLYPSGYSASAIEMRARVKLPAGMGWGSALRAGAESNGWIQFEPVSLETLIDSPVYAGAAYRRVELDPPGTAYPAVLHLFTDREGAKAPSEEQIEAHRRLVVQAERLFGSRPWGHYDLLLANGKGIGLTSLEHHESSENAYDGHYFDPWGEASRRRDNVAHELIHAWNGKFRRPADLWTADFNTPGGNSLLWVYEGLTQYWGIVLATRSGIITPDQLRWRLSRNAAWLRAIPGRQWRSLQDTTNDPAMASANHGPWPSWSRQQDYYNESALLVWLDADTLIRERSNGQRSLDDLAPRFFAGRPGQKGPDLYTFDDVVAAMDAVLPNDWRRFFRERLDRTVPDVPLEGLSRAGWRVDYGDVRSAIDLASLDPDKPILWLGNSLGVGIGKDGEVDEVSWDTPAFREGLFAGDKIVTVNLRAYSPERIEAALVANKGGGKPVELMVRREDDFRLVRFDLRTGPRHPSLARIEGSSDLLAEILKPR